MKIGVGMIPWSVVSSPALAAESGRVWRRENMGRDVGRGTREEMRGAGSGVRGT
jgi:hypothetical protein